MKKNLFILLFVLSVFSVYGQLLDRQDLSASLPKGRQLSETEIYHRIRRVAYERRLGLDSITAMKLVLADQAEQQGIQSALENRSLSVEGRAAAIAEYRKRSEAVTSFVLNKDKRARLKTSRSEQGSRLKVVEQKNPVSAALVKVMSRYSDGVSAIQNNSRLDAASRSRKIAELGRERDRGLHELDSLHLQGIKELNEQQMKYWLRPVVAPDSTQRRTKELLERNRKALLPVERIK